MITLLNTTGEYINISAIIGVIGGIIGVIAGSWALWDRFQNRMPKIKVLSPYQFTSNDGVTGILLLSAYFRFSNISQTPTYLFFETLKAELFYNELNEWKYVRNLRPLKEKIETDLAPEVSFMMGINKAQNLDAFKETRVKYSEPLCGYLTFHIESVKFTKLRGEILDSRHKKIKFEIDFNRMEII